MIAGPILAAGRSTRMAPDHKLLLKDKSGQTMPARVADALLASQARPLIAVLGHRAAEIGAGLGSRAILKVLATEYAAGLSASLCAGIAALPGAAEAVVICLADMPWIEPALIDALIAAHAPARRRDIIVPVFAGRRGNPVLIGRRFFSDLAALRGDTGAKPLLHRYADQVWEVTAPSDAVLRDVDMDAALYSEQAG